MDVGDQRFILAVVCVVVWTGDWGGIQAQEGEILSSVYGNSHR